MNFRQKIALYLNFFLARFDLGWLGRLSRAERQELKAVSSGGRVSVGQCLVVRNYPAKHPKNLIFLSRSIWANKFLKNARICRPDIVSVSLVRVAGVMYFRIAEKLISGEHLKNFSNLQAEALGRDLSIWHSLGDEIYSTYARRFYVSNEKAMRRYWRHFSFDMSGAPVYLKEWQELTDLAKSWLTDNEFLGEFATTHGDIHSRNMVWSEDATRFYWIDLEGVRRRPRRHDLSAVMLSMMGESKSWQSIDNFEKTYFGTDIDGLRAWYKHRAKWFALANIYRGNQKLGQPASRRPNVQLLDNETRVRAGIKYFSRAKAALSVEVDSSVSTGVLVREIIAQSLVEERDIRVHLQSLGKSI